VIGGAYCQQFGIMALDEIAQRDGAGRAGDVEKQIVNIGKAPEAVLLDPR
jgi:hypothetical protein